MLWHHHFNSLRWLNSDWRKSFVCWTCWTMNYYARPSTFSTSQASVVIRMRSKYVRSCWEDEKAVVMSLPWQPLVEIVWPRTSSVHVMQRHLFLVPSWSQSSVCFHVRGRGDVRGTGELRLCNVIERLGSSAQLTLNLTASLRHSKSE